MENWDLQALVRGCNYNLEGVANSMEFSNFSAQSSNSSCFGFAPVTIDEDDEIFRAFPQLFDATTALDELEELYKPFYPILQPDSPPIIPISSPLVQQEVTGEEKDEPKKLKSVKESSSICRKSRKNQQSKRVVKEVKEQDLFSDVWAWRKYGQKPIKGSPYPRSYYRCSSSKGCSARKQVERSNSNPDLFIITYSAEHNHDHPTRRNSLASSTRTKFPKSQNKVKISKHKLVPVKEEAQRLLEEDEVSQESPRDLMYGDEAVPSFENFDRKFKELSELMAEPVMADGFFSDQYSDSYFESSWFLGHSSSTVTGAC